MAELISKEKFLEIISGGYELTSIGGIAKLTPDESSVNVYIVLDRSGKSLISKKFT